MMISPKNCLTEPELGNTVEGKHAIMLRSERRSAANSDESAYRKLIEGIYSGMEMVSLA